MGEKSGLALNAADSGWPVAAASEPGHKKNGTGTDDVGLPKVQKVEQGVITVAGTNEVQTVTITGAPTGGNFTLTFNGQTTANIPWNATAAQVQAALEALSNIDPGDVAVTGGPGPGTPYVVTFAEQGAYSGTNVAQMTAAHTFTGGTTPNLSVSTTTGGAVT